MTRKLPLQCAVETNPVRTRIRFVWPAPGLPAFVQDEEHIGAIIAQEDPDPEVVRGWAGRLALRGVDETIPIPLSVEAVELWDSARSGPAHQRICHARARPADSPSCGSFCEPVNGWLRLRHGGSNSTT